MREIVVLIFISAGAFFIITAAIGILRMPDLFLRMSASAKAGTLGMGLILIGVAIHFNLFSITTRSVAITFFLLLTAPIAAHMIGRAAYFDGVPIWPGTKIDELRSHYHLSTHELDSKVVTIDDQLPTITVFREGDDFQQED